MVIWNNVMTGNAVTYTPQSGTNKQDDKYIYDLIGNIFNINIRTTACGVGGKDSLDRAFDYDPLYRVISGTGRENVSGGNYPFPGWDDFVRSSDPNSTQAYTRKYAYDKVGNIQQVKQLGTSGFTRDFSYFSNQNRLEEVEISTNSYNFTYDNAGNQLTENTTRQFEWDTANRLILFKNQTGMAEPSVIAQYLYDSAGNRVKKIVRKQGGDYEIRTYIDGIFEYYTDETDEQNTVHIMDDQSRIATVRIGDAMGDTTPAIKYELENNIYSSMVVLDSVGAVVNTQEYYPFGETSFGSYGKKRYQYVGKERDEESGLYYYGARYYSPWIARFISCDPLSAKYTQLSPYNYSDNNPINDFDIDGMQNNNSEGSEQGGTGTSSITNTKEISMVEEGAIKNATLNIVKEKEKKAEDAQLEYDNLVSNHEGGLKKKNIKKYEKESGLKNAKEELAVWKDIKSRIDDMIETFKIVMPEEYNYLNNLPVNININYSSTLGSGGKNNPQSTRIPASRMTVMQFGSDVQETAWTGEFDGDIEITIWGEAGNSLNTRYLANEFGDIDYFFKNVIPGDSDSYGKWVTTGSDKYSGYWSDPTGAGQVSFNYQYNFENKFNEIRKNYTIDKIDRINWIIRK